jgi:5-methylcytosine-specific restriction endonuclease McrA
MTTASLAAKPALLLNADFRPLSHYPLSTLGWEDTVRAVVKNTVSVVAEYDEVVRSPSITMRLPSVVALREYVKPSTHVAFTRFNVFLRDRFRCQYCGERHKTHELTFDHVVPRAKGGLTTWENIVAACWGCNSEKDCNHGKPMTAPRKPTVWELQAAQLEFPPNYMHESWQDFISKSYWDAELEPG